MPKIQIKRQCPEEGVHVFFSREPLCQKNEAVESGGDPAENELLNATIAIAGVAMAVCKPYSLAIMKAPSYEWAEIEPSILRLMTAFNLPLESIPDEPAETEWLDV